MKPSDYPPPFSVREVIAESTDLPDERIDVGVLIVGAGPAGLACAIRLGQLLEAEPHVAERLGDVPFAVLEKGKQVGSHLLSGAVVNPRSLRALFGEQKRMADMPFHGEVRSESVYYLTRHQTLRIPAPPTMKNHGNHVASVSELGRWLGQEAEAVGATILPETTATKLLVEHGRVRGVRTGDRGRGRDGEPLANLEPGSDIVARVTVLCEGTQGHLTGAAIEKFGLAGESPQVWALGVKEVWKVPRPLDRVIHTMGWPLRNNPRYREFGGSFIYPRRHRHGHARDGGRPRLPRRGALGARPAAGAEDASARASHPRRRRARRVGGEDDSRGRLRRACRSSCTRRGCCSAATVRGSSTCRR